MPPIYTCLKRGLSLENHFLVIGKDLKLLRFVVMQLCNKSLKGLGLRLMAWLRAWERKPCIMSVSLIPCGIQLRFLDKNRKG
jgi:hypothetical protein